MEVGTGLHSCSSYLVSRALTATQGQHKEFVFLNRGAEEGIRDIRITLKTDHLFIHVQKFKTNLCIFRSK